MSRAQHNEQLLDPDHGLSRMYTDDPTHPYIFLLSFARSRYCGCPTAAESCPVGYSSSSSGFFSPRVVSSMCFNKFVLCNLSKASHNTRRTPDVKNRMRERISNDQKHALLATCTKPARTFEAATWASRISTVLNFLRQRKQIGLSWSCK